MHTMQMHLPSHFQCGAYRFPLQGGAARPLLMGILNVTPDSFSDGGRYLQLDAALNHAEQMIEQGVDIIDIGGESSRPGARSLSVQEELERVLPLVFALRDCGVPLSIDTCKPQVMREVLATGAHMINDIQGFTQPDSIAAVADSDCGICVMHMQNRPQNMQTAPHYTDVVQEVGVFLQARTQALQDAGVASARICIDPGFGFGKTLQHNLALFRQAAQLSADCGLPLLAGISNKSMLGALTGREVGQRQAANAAAHTLLLTHGASILRVHDVAAAQDCLRIWQALQQQQD
ncbi:dihydropteroate synthase [Massilia sp. W12]|uniref:dihydropteroate synthase n=1 Tax=Massilia sp. W12 TaxID=3126507 RepID=UPI0030CD3F1C